MIISNQHAIIQAVKQVALDELLASVLGEVDDQCNVVTKLFQLLQPRTSIAKYTPVRIATATGDMSPTNRQQYQFMPVN